MARVTFATPPEAHEPRREVIRGRPRATNRDGGLLQMLALQVNLVALVLFGAYLAGYLGPSMEFPQGAGRIIPASELDARFEELLAQNAKLDAQNAKLLKVDERLQQLERRNRSGTARRAAPIPIDVPIPIARPPRAPEPDPEPDEQQQGDLAPESGDPAPGPMITSNLGFLVVAGLTSVLYVGIVSALLTPA